MVRILRSLSFRSPAHEERDGAVRPLRSFLLIALVVGQTIAVGTTPARAGGRGREFPIPTPGSIPWGIAAGPDGNLWFTEFLGNKVGYVRPSAAAPGLS
jgi:streptogramin lyase